MALAYVTFGFVKIRHFFSKIGCNLLEKNLSVDYSSHQYKIPVLSPSSLRPTPQIIPESSKAQPERKEN